MPDRTLRYRIQVDAHFPHTVAVLKNELPIPKQQGHEQRGDRYQQGYDKHNEFRNQL